MVCGKLLVAAHFDNVVDLLWKDESSRIKRIDHKKKTPRNNVNSLFYFYQLIATKIIVLKNNVEGIQ